jgi:hypothetical protein
VVTAHEWPSPIRKDKTGPLTESRIQDLDDIFCCEGFATGKTEFFHLQCPGLVQEGQKVIVGKGGNASVSRSGTFKAKRAGQIADRTGMKP